jgi:hypothetical protein
MTKFELVVADSPTGDDVGVEIFIGAFGWAVVYWGENQKEPMVEFARHPGVPRVAVADARRMLDAAVRRLEEMNQPGERLSIEDFESRAKRREADAEEA